MNAWVVRGVALAVMHVVVRALLGFAVAQWPLQGGWLRWLGFAVVVLVAAAWGVVDGRADRRAYPDPDRGADLTILWLKAAVVGGLLAGVAAWLVDLVPGFDLGDNKLFFELTSGAAFTVLLIFVSGMLGIVIGRVLANRAIAKAPDVPGSHRRSDDTVTLTK